MSGNNSKGIVTELQLRRLTSGDKPYDVKVAGVSGLYVRIGKSGIKSFRWDRGRGQKPRHITYGRFPDISLKQARDMHEKAKEKHSAGIIDEIDATAPKTVAELAEVFYSDRIMPTRKRPDIVRQVLDHDIIPSIGNLRLSSVNTLAVRRTVKVMVDRGAKSHAGRCLAILKQMFRFGVSITVMDTNPAASLDKTDLGAGDNRRKRVLNDDEIQQFWRILEAQSRLSIQVRVGLQLLILLGIRSGELRQTKWKDVDLDKGILTVPVENQKLNPKQYENAKPFIVPLDDFSISLFMQLQGVDDIWVFIGRSASSPITRKVFSTAVKRMLEKHQEIKPFTPHDFRRTIRTNLSSLKVQQHIAELCLNHSLGRMIDTYDQYIYLDERREALEKWSQRLQVILGKHDNVVELEKVG